MQSIKQAIRTALLVGASVMIAFANPVLVFAEETQPPTAPATTEQTTTTPQSSPSSTTPSTEQTTKSSESATPSPSSSQPVTTTTPAPSVVAKPKPTYTYDADTGRWNTNEWVYDPASGTYKEKPAPVIPSATSSTEPSAQSAIDTKTTAAIANAIDSIAASGDASVLHNTTGGSATTGDASSTATIINNVNSSLTSSANKQAASFVSDVMGDVNGDIILQPMLLKAMLEANAEQAGAASNVTSKTDTDVTNDITLGATSGNALVSGNTKAGNATSGTANTVANVVNVVNSMVASNQSFVGTINIYGNLNGDILIAPDFIPQLLASNAASSAVAPVGSASVTSNSTQSIVNNIALAAKTGESVVSGNTNAGSATSGNADTNAVIFNLTGHEIVASNSLLVFVNVLGRWVGVIIDAPAGATAAAIGSGVTTNAVSPDLVIDATDTTQLTNNINLTSQSGNASVVGNTTGGSALSGNATASANVANIANSQIGVTGWFGILFINVFGNWFGSFGVDTAAGDPVASKSGTKSAANTAGPVRVMRFIPRLPVATPVSVVQGNTVSPSVDVEKSTQNTSEVKGVTDDDSLMPTNEGITYESVLPIDEINPLLVLGSLVLIGGSLYGIRKLL